MHLLGFDRDDPAVQRVGKPDGAVERWADLLKHLPHCGHFAHFAAATSRAVARADEIHTWERLALPRFASREAQVGVRAHAPQMGTDGRDGEQAAELFFRTSTAKIREIKIDQVLLLDGWMVLLVQMLV